MPTIPSFERLHLHEIGLPLFVLVKQQDRRTVVERGDAVCRPINLAILVRLPSASILELERTDTHHPMNPGSEDPRRHSRWAWRRHGGGVSVSTCFGDEPTRRQFQNGRDVLWMMLFKGLPRMISTFGSECRHQPVHIHDKMTPLIVDPFFHDFEQR